MQKIFKSLLTLNLLIIVSSFSTEVVSETENGMIPIEKLVCYGKGGSLRLSPSGDFVAQMVPVDKNICDIKDKTDQELAKTDRVLVVTNLATMEPKVLSGTTAGTAVTSFSWINEDKLLVSRDSRAGFNSRSLYTIDKDGKNTKQLIAAKENRSSAGYQVPSFYASYRKFPEKIMISVNRGSSTRLNRDLYWLDINTKQKTLAARVPTIKGEIFFGFELDWNGVPRGFSTFTSAGPDMGLLTNFYIYNEDGSHEKISSCRHQEACFAPLGFDIDNRTLLGVGQAVQKDGSIIDETDTSALWGWDIETREYTEMIYHDPDFDVSRENALSLWYEKDGSDLYGFSYEAAETKKIFFNSYFASVVKSLEGAFPGYRISLSDWNDDLTKFIALVDNAKDPGSAYMFDITKGSLSLVTSYAPWLKDYNLASTEPFTYIARDGLELHGYITLPVDYKKGTKIPFILHPHGGPNARDFGGYSPEVQFYASRGYGVIQPNFRGSTGHGRNEMILANHEMGKTMQTDKYDALFWARDAGYVDMDKVCISGASYGGYAAMHAATKMPGMFKCVISYVGVYDLTSKDLRGLQWGEISQPMEWIEKGNQDIKKDYDNLYDNSPMFFAENITEPVLIITGRRDPNVRYQETEDMVGELKKYGKEHQYIIKGDEGHGFRNETARLELYKEYEKFLAKYLD